MDVGFLKPHSKNTNQDKVSYSLQDDSGFSFLLIFRYTLFFIMEAGFITLAWYCSDHPRALPSYVNFDLRSVKSGFITLFNLWHTIAIACGLSICAETFGKEWAAREERTDIVSTVSSGIIDRIYYTCTTRATKTFRTSFFLFLGLVVMRTTGSSTVTATDGVPSSRTLPIGLISTTSLTPDSTSSNSITFQVRLAEASMVVKLEQLIKVPWGYVPQPGWLIPLPAQDLNMTNRVEYETDLVGFNYTCQ